MPKLDFNLKERISNLPSEDLKEIVLKLASRHADVLNYIQVHYLEKETGELDLYEKTKKDLNLLFVKGYKGFSEQLRAANMVSACIKRINEFTSISKNKVLEAELLIFILDEAFSYPADFFGSCFTAFDSRVGITLKRLINLLNKMHPDYLANYQDRVNNFLDLLHRRSNHIDTIYNLPKAI
jgi:hypothetical protein